MKELKETLIKELRKIPIHGHAGYDDAYVHWELVLETIEKVFKSFNPASQRQDRP